MTSPITLSRRERLFLVILISVVLFKLWLVGAQTIQAIGPSGHDDRLFLRMTATILNGEWLGHYNQVTLAKGSFFSLFAAGAFALGIPLFTAQHLLYAVACGVVLRSLRPLKLSLLWRAGLFTTLLFNPVTYDTAGHTRVLRQNITPALSLLILAALIALHLRQKESARRLAPWALLLGAALSAFYLTREDGIWIAPAVLLPWAATVWLIWRGDQMNRMAKLGVVIVVPLVVYGAGILTIGLLNWSHYGVFTTCEFRHPSFKAAYGALARVKPARWHPYITVARETRERIYAVSPAFAKLRPELEGQLGANWAANSQQLLKLPPEDREIGGGWFMWALRDAVTNTGDARTGGEAMAYYARLADEVNAACDQGLLEAGPARSGFLPPWDNRYMPHFISAVQRAAIQLFTLEGLQVTPRPSQGPPDLLILFSDLTRERLSPIEGEKSPLKRQDALNRIRLSILGRIGQSYALTLPWLGIVALLCSVLGSLRALNLRRMPYWGILSAGLLGSGSALVLICALVDTTSFPAISVIYMTGGYGFLILFIFTGTWSFRPPAPQPKIR